MTTDPRTCPYCSTLNSATASYCSDCGKDLSGLEHAGFWIRFAAIFIDGLILIIPNIIISAIASGDLGTGLALQLLLNLGYVLGFWMSNGATPGKMIFGLKIVRRDGEEIGPSTAVARYVGYILSWITFGIGFLMIAFSREKRGLHDLVADTIVVRTR